MESIVVGQLVQLLYRAEEKNAWWEYGVVRHIFDDRIEIKRNKANPFMHIISIGEVEKEMVNKQPVGSIVTYLFKDGEPVMAKRKLISGYKFEPIN